MFALVSETYSVVSRLSPGTAGMINLLQLLLVRNVVQVGSGMLPYRMQKGGDERAGRKNWEREWRYGETKEHNLP